MSETQPSSSSCPRCGSKEHWYPTGRVNPDDLDAAKAGGPKAPVEMSVKGGHCLKCDYEEEAVWK